MDTLEIKNFLPLTLILLAIFLINATAKSALVRGVIAPTAVHQVKAR